MKKYTSIVLIAIIPSLLSSAQKEYRMIKPIPVPGSILGNKGIDSATMKSLSEDQQRILYDIQHPGCLKSLCGFNDQVISTEHKKFLKDMPKEITNGLQIRVKKVKGSSLINPDGSHRGSCCQKCSDVHIHKAWILTSMASVPSGVAFFYTMACYCPASLCGWAACALPIAVAPPVTAAGCTEVGICTYHRCCAHDNIMEFDNSNDYSSEEETD